MSTNTEITATPSRVITPKARSLTPLPTWAGFIYLAVVVDVWSRRIVGWSRSARR